MQKQVSTKQSLPQVFKESYSPRIGEAHPLRGLNYHDLASEFVQCFPIGSVVAVEVFDQFIIQHGGVKPPSDMDKDSDGWQAFVLRRHNARQGLNKAGTHPRMSESGLDCFYLDVLDKGGKYKVVAPIDKLVNSDMPLKSLSVNRAHLKEIDMLLQSSNFEQLSPEQQVELRHFKHVLSTFWDDTQHKAKQLQGGFVELKNRIGATALQGVDVLKGSQLSFDFDDALDDFEIESHPQNASAALAASQATGKDIDVSPEPASSEDGTAK